MSARWLTGPKANLRETYHATLRLIPERVALARSPWAVASGPHSVTSAVLQDASSRVWPGIQSINLRAGFAEAPESRAVAMRRWFAAEGREARWVWAHRNERT